MRKFEKLRVSLRREGIDQQYLSKQIGRSTPYISERLCGHREWQLEDIYSIMDLIHRPYEEIPIYFPRKGVPVTRIQTRPPPKQSGVSDAADGQAGGEKEEKGPGDCRVCAGKKNGVSAGAKTAEGEIE